MERNRNRRNQCPRCSGLKLKTSAYCRTCGNAIRAEERKAAMVRERSTGIPRRSRKAQTLLAQYQETHDDGDLEAYALARARDWGLLWRQ